MRWYKTYARIVKRFALLPIRIGDETRWLETVYLRQEWCPYMLFNWRPDRFVSKSDYLNYRNRRLSNEN